MPSPKLQSLYPMHTAAGDLELFGLDSAGTVWRNARSGDSWQTWQPNFRDARPKVSLATVEGNEDGYTYVFGLDRVGTLWRLAHVGGAWRSWSCFRARRR